MSGVVIVGAGPGGASLAFLLARRGIDVTLLERQTDFAREFRGEVLLPGGLEPFKQMGLWDELDTVPHVTLNAAQLYVNGKFRVRAAFDPATFGDLTPRWTSQPALLEMLVRECGRFPNFHFERGVHVRDLMHDGDRVSGVTLDGGREIRAGLVVGADGRTSIVRRRAQVRVHDDPTPMDVVWCRLPVPEWFVTDPHLRGYLGGGHLLITAPVPEGYMQIGWIIAKGKYGELRERGIPELLDRMAAHASPDFAEHLRRHRNDAVQPFLLSVVSDRVAHWSRPGLLLIGDAAHTMSPVGAQGLNIAIRDAIVAANHLVPAFEHGAAPDALDAAAQRIEAERLPEVVEIQNFQAVPPRVLLRNAWWARIVLALLPYVLRSGITGTRGVGLIRRVAFGVTDVRLAV
jgi:2-polyprenyl-6-methoxyphenol hydroxylase-like FAD-dependent oxidoreductase